MECRKILLSIRKQREEKLKAYKVLCAKFNDSHLGPPFDLIKKRQALLTLELPFEIDSVSINEARVKYAEKNDGGKVQDVQSLNRILIKSGVTSDRSPKLEKIWKAGKEWANIKSNNDYYLRQEYVNQSLLNSLRARKIWPLVHINGHPPMEIDFDDLRHEATFQAVCQGINLSNYKKSTKQVLLSKLNKIREYLLGINKNQNSPVPGIDLFQLAAYFEYLETKCLSSPINYYRKLLDVRLLFYVPLPSTTLSQLTLSNIDQHARVLNWGQEKHPLPNSFLELAQSLLDEKEPLLKHNTKQLDRFISQSSKAKSANLKANITPLQIKRSLTYISHSEGFFCDYLPRR